MHVQERPREPVRMGMDGVFMDGNASPVRCRAAVLEVSFDLEPFSGPPDVDAARASQRHLCELAHGMPAVGIVGMVEKGHFHGHIVLIGALCRQSAGAWTKAYAYTFHLGQLGPASDCLVGVDQIGPS
ncbi:unannotated protein [freshwater metagenome]|uniref:Unannotated protein n=1 Tax=freshwater metagenome TaxID=449393 RepID=A0A6J6XXT9_9ZZZZ